MKCKLFFINPAGSHNVFMGWQYFFNKFFDSYIYNHGEKNKQLGNFKKLTPKKLIIFLKNFIAFYDKKDLNINNSDFVVLGDIFTNTLCYTLKKGKIFYYSEYFNFYKSNIKKILFFIIGFIFFRNKKIIVPTMLAKKTFSNISKNVLYFPIIYYGEVYENKKNTYDTISLLFVGRMSQNFKNIDFLIDNYLKLRNNFNIELNLVGKIFDSKYLNGNHNFLNKNNINYLGEKNPNELSEIYKINDIFILPSNSDPIGAVILEAMAHGCAVITSDTVGSSCYIEVGKNGLIFKTNNSEDLVNSIKTLLLKNELLVKYKKYSTKIIKSKFWYKNEILLDQKFEDFNYFINN